MKMPKRILSWLLMICMLLTLASCGKEDGEKDGGNKPAAAPKSRLFKGEVTEDNGTTSYWCKVTGDRYELEMISPQTGELKAYTKVEDGVYRLEGFLEQKVAYIDLEAGEIREEIISSEAVTVRLEKMQNGYCRIAESIELPDMAYGMSYAIELRDDGTYASHDRTSIALEYRRESKRDILRMESSNLLGGANEAWIEGETITAYKCVSGTYSVKDRGTAKLLSFAAAPNAVLYADMFDSMEAMLAKDTLTLKVDGETLTMSRMDDNRYFCMTDEGELIIELHDDGAFAMLVGAGEVLYTEDLVVCDPGKSLRAMIDGGIAFEIEGDKLTISGDGMGETIILTEVK